MKISVCGKGGSGKTVITTLLARVLRDRGYRVLVVDSDESNSGLHRLLGFDMAPVPLVDLVGGKQEVKNAFPKDRSLQSAVGTNVLVQDQVGLRDLPPLYVVERDGISLVAVGKILQSLEGCACPMGVLSREFLRKLHLREDEVAIVDMEAGVEHFGRGVEASIDSVIIVVDPSLESLELAERVSSMTEGIGVRNTWALLNKVTSDEIASTLRQELRQRNVDVVGFVRYDPQVFEACLTGLPVQSGEAARDVEAVVDAVLAARAT
jgi:CO dehydrogenase maturation factor